MSENPIQNALDRIQQAIETIAELDAPNFTDNTTAMLRQKAEKLRTEDKKARQANRIGEIIIALHRETDIPDNMEIQKTQVDAIGFTLKWLEDKYLIGDPADGKTVLDADGIACVNALLAAVDADDRSAILSEAAYVRGLFNAIADSVEKNRN